MITRLIFCAPYRIPVATVSLQFDHNLIGVTRNIIVSPVNTRDLYRYLSQYGIDTNRFEHLPDQELIDHYPEIDHWVFENDYRNNWLKQQAIKLAALDYVDYDVALIHDPDTWMIDTYCPIDNLGTPCMLALENITEGSYDPVLPSVLGMSRQTQHCFVTEFLPIYQQDWRSLKSTLEQRHQQHFLDAIIDHVPETDTFDGAHSIKWFSEYEFLGNWIAAHRPVNFLFQRRFEIESIEDLARLDKTRYNSICDQSSGMTPALGFDDWHTGNIPNYSRCIQLLQSHFPHLQSTQPTF
jgi:hypothetical protein